MNRFKIPCPANCLAHALISLSMLSAISSARAEDAAKTVLNVRDQKQFFADDLLIAEQRGIERRVHQARKHPDNPIFKPEQPWENGNLAGGKVVRREDGTLQLTYGTYCGKNPSAGHTWCLAVSSDGLHWTRPNLGLVDYEGSKENNRLPVGRLGYFDQRETDPARRYKAVYCPGPGPLGVGVSFSRDGLIWTDYAGNPVHKKAGDTHSLLGWDPNHQQYVGYFRPQQGRRVIGRSTSTDFENWSDIKVIMAPDNRDPPGTEFYFLNVSLVDGVYWGTLGVLKLNEQRQEHPTAFGGDDNTQTVQTVFSRDGIHWVRPGDRRPLIPLGEPGNWDEYYTNVLWGDPVVMRDELWFYYQGSNVRHARLVHQIPNGPFTSAQAGSVVNGRLIGGQIGLAKLRLDGRVSLHASAEEGSIMTPTLAFTGKSLELNCTTGEQGTVRVEIQDAEGKPISGYALQDCQPIRGDAIRRPVSWKGGDVNLLANTPVRLRFVMQDADLYTFQFR